MVAVLENHRVHMMEPPDWEVQVLALKSHPVHCPLSL